MVQKEPFLKIQLTLHKNFQYFKSIKSPSSTFKQANPPKNQYLPDLQFNVQVSGISPLHGDPQLHLIAIFLFPFFETTFQGT